MLSEGYSTWSVCVCVSVTQHLTLYVQSISVVFERFRSVSDLRLRFRNHIHIVCDRACGAGSNHGVLGNAQLLCQLASPVCLFYHYCSPYRVGNTPATHEFTAHADKCSASTEIRQLTVSEAGGGKCF